MPTAFRLGAEFWLGKIPKDMTENDTRIRKSAFIGFNLLNPLNWYFYGFLSALTLESVLQMIYAHQDIDVLPKLPPFLAQTGLSALPGDDGVLISFTPAVDYTIEFVDPARTIKAGLTIAGKASLFGLNILVDINIDIVGVGCDIFFAFEPIKIGNGVIQLSKSMHEVNTGPAARMQMLLTKGLMPNITIHGYAEFLGMGMGFNGVVTQHDFRLSGELKLFNVLESEAEIFWNVVTDFFEVRGNITQREGFLDMLEKAGQNMWKKITHRRIAKEQLSNSLVQAENASHLAAMVHEHSNIRYLTVLDEEPWSDNDIRVEFANGRMLTQQKFFDFVPFRIFIDEMSFVLHCEQGEEKNITTRMRIRKVLFGKTTYVNKTTQLDITRPKLLIQDILSA